MRGWLKDAAPRWALHRGEGIVGNTGAIETAVIGAAATTARFDLLLQRLAGPVHADSGVVGRDAADAGEVAQAVAIHFDRGRVFWLQTRRESPGALADGVAGV